MKSKFMNQDEKINYLLNTPIPKLIFKMALPTITIMFVTNFYNVVDTFFINKINTQSSAAVGIVFSFMTFIQAIGFFFGHGSGNYISKKLGIKNFDEASKMIATSFFTAFFIGILIAIIGLLFLEPISMLLGSTKTILPYTKSYLSIILLGTPFIMTSFVINNQLRYQGNASYAMFGIIIGAIINLILDPILIFVFQFGIFGAGLATTLSQILSFVILIYVCQKGKNIKILFRNFLPSYYLYKEILICGLPSLCRQSLSSISQILLNFSIIKYGGIIADSGIAAISIVSKVFIVSNAAIIGFGQGFQPVCAMNYGAKNYNRVIEGFWFCVKFSLIFLLVISISGFIFSEQIILIFEKDDINIINIGKFVLKVQFLVFFLNSWTIISSMMLQSIGKSFMASFLASSRQGLFFIPLILILPNIIGFVGIQICQPISDICTFIMSIPFTLIAIKELKRLSNNLD